LLLVALAWRAVRELRALAVELRDAARLRRTIRERSNARLAVIHDPVPAAHAVGGVLTSRGAVVITSSMLALLDADEQAAVIAHEQAHLRQRHATFMAALRLCAALNPLIASMVRDMRFALERWADEDAAARTGRTTLASALAKAALAVLDSSAHGPAAWALAFHRHGVTDRVAALLAEPNRRSTPAWALLALSLTAALALAWAMHDTERFFEAVRVWSHG
jgi:beta-lactamase regulating signal transducer with metallopeptidase domain